MILMRRHAQRVDDVRRRPEHRGRGWDSLHRFGQRLPHRFGRVPRRAARKGKAKPRSEGCARRQAELPALAAHSPGLRGVRGRHAARAPASPIQAGALGDARSASAAARRRRTDHRGPRAKDWTIAVAGARGRVGGGRGFSRLRHAPVYRPTMQPSGAERRNPPRAPGVDARGERRWVFRGGVRPRLCEQGALRRRRPARRGCGPGAWLHGAPVGAAQRLVERFVGLQLHDAEAQRQHRAALRARGVAEPRRRCGRRRRWRRPPRCAGSSTCELVAAQAPGDVGARSASRTQQPTSLRSAASRRRGPARR